MLTSPAYAGTDDYGAPPSGSAEVVDGGIGASAVVALNGGVAPPAGVSRCTPWAPLNGSTFEQASTVEATRVSADGTTQTLYARDCTGVLQYLWVGPITAADVATLARDTVRAQLPTPQPDFAPPADSMFVNYDTWFAVTETDPVTATATVPGLSVTATATPTSITLDTGTHIDGDTTTIECDLWGSTNRPANGCVWTPAHPSVEQVTGTNDYRYHATVTLTWNVTWQATNGQTGNLGTTSTSTPVLIAVREIQTIGAPNP
jgi:hypothetical protein